MDHSLSRHQQAPPIPWRAVALVAAAVAAAELLLLVMAGAAIFVDPGGRAGAEVAKPKAAATKTKAQPSEGSKDTGQARTALQPTSPRPVAQLPRRRVAVMVLNGNGVTGAAAAAARRVSRRGYRIGTVGNAPGGNYTRSIVMYRRGFAGEGARLARDLGVRIVGPLDGIRARDLDGAHTVFVIGS